MTFISGNRYITFGTTTGYVSKQLSHPEAHAAAAAACQPSPVYVVADNVYVGHEAFGGQSSDVQPEPSAEEFLLKGLAAASNALKGAAVSHAITALHKQHSRDGRPTRFIPEGGA